MIHLQKLFLKCMLAYDINAATKAFEQYKSASQSHLDTLVFHEGKIASVTVYTGDDEPTYHTGDDSMALSFGDAIHDNAKQMELGLKALKLLRRTCAMAI
jgi:hypothetical protein